jgi:hypothetical protein
LLQKQATVLALMRILKKKGKSNRERKKEKNRKKGQQIDFANI